MNAITKSENGAEPVEMQTPARQQSAPAPKKRKPVRLVLMLALPLALVIGGGYVWVTGGRFQETENAYLQQPKVSIASEAAGRVVEVNVENDRPVKAGDILFRVEPEPYRIALAQAEAALAGAKLNVEQLRAGYSQAMAQRRLATSEVDFLEMQLRRQADLSRKGISSKAALDEARRDLQKAKESQIAAGQAVAGALAALGGIIEIDTDKHPNVQAARATRDKATYQLERATVRAPADGIVSKASSFKVGQFVGVGTPLFALVETDDTWVEANFKETQLTNMRPGQVAEIEFDTYPGHAVEAVVESIGAGTGAEFSLLPAQNATGNWVKVTQRIPVRLRLDTEETALPLRTGMSATVTVDTGVSRGLGGVFGMANAAQ